MTEARMWRQGLEVNPLVDRGQEFEVVGAPFICGNMSPTPHATEWEAHPTFAILKPKIDDDGSLSFTAMAMITDDLEGSLLRGQDQIDANRRFKKSLFKFFQQTIPDLWKTPTFARYDDQVLHTLFFLNPSIPRLFPPSEYK